MPPDALAAVLASDSLAVASENTILAVIDTYLSGPVAHGLAKIHSAAAAAAAVSTNGSYGSCGGACVGCNEAAGGGHDSVRHQLPEALRQLLAAVRLPLCSGAFLAGAVRRMPWLCAVLRHQHHSELHLLQQYYRCGGDQGVTLCRFGLVLQLHRGKASMHQELFHSARGRAHGLCLRQIIPSQGLCHCRPLQPIDSAVQPAMKQLLVRCRMQTARSELNVCSPLLKVL